MARRSRSGFGGIVIMLFGAWLIAQVALPSRSPSPVVSSPPAVVEATPATSKDETAESPSTEQRVEPPKPISSSPQFRWVKGSKVAFRSGPGKEFAILDRFNPGRKVTLLENGDEWSRVADVLTVREGWISTRLLVDRQPVARLSKPRPQPEETPPIVRLPQISDAEIAERIIAESISEYSGSCPCPFNVDRGGRRCGKRSAYSRPGGASPVCFIGDVTPGMIASSRSRL